MRKSLAALWIVLILLFSFAACGEEPAQVVTPNEEGIAAGGIGDIMRAPLLDFTVQEVRTHTTYAEQQAYSGEKFLDVLVRITNTGAEAQTLLDNDFQLRWGTSGFVDPLVAFDESMAPLEITLAPGESAEYHYLFGVSEYVTEFSFCYLYSLQTVGSAELYAVDFSL